jgi:hypothetical protein
LPKLGASITKRYLKRDDQDVVSKVAWRFYRKLSNYDYPAHIFSQDVKWACRREQSHRSQHNVEPLDDKMLTKLEKNSNLTVNPFPGLEVNSDRQSIIRRLKPNDADCVRMLTNGRTLAAIGNRLGISVPAVRARFRGIKRKIARIKRMDDELQKRMSKEFTFPKANQTCVAQEAHLQIISNQPGKCSRKETEIDESRNLRTS